jgi:hypothetical protein
VDEVDNELNATRKQPRCFIPARLALYPSQSMFTRSHAALPSPLSLGASILRQVTTTALLLTSDAPSGTADGADVSYVACKLPPTSPEAGFILGQPAISISPAAEVGAVWWGSATAVAREFGAEGCTTVWLAGGRSVHVFGSTPPDCKATWSAVPGGKGALLTAASPGSPPLWQVHLPADGRPARLTCAGFCPLASNATPCTPSQASGLDLPGSAPSDPATAVPARRPAASPPEAPAAGVRRLMAADGGYGGYGTTPPPTDPPPPPETTAPPAPFNPVARLLEVARLNQEALQAQAQAGATELLDEWRSVVNRGG